MARHISVVIGVIIGLIFPISARAAANLTATPITWNVVGLDSNDVTTGPDTFPVGVRVCNTGDAAATNVQPTFNWDSSNSYINLRSGSYGDVAYPALPSLAAGDCFDFYFEVEITRDTAAFDTTREYHVDVTADGGISTSTPTPREIYVEHLVEQARNGIIQFYLDGVLVPAGGTMNLEVGKEYTIEVTGKTATNGYEQLENLITFPNSIFQVISATPGQTDGVLSDYSANTSPNIQGGTEPVTDFEGLYTDSCTWDNDPTSGTYRSCLGSGKTGGDASVSYRVRILSDGGGSPVSLYSLIYDFSGSSYHYNNDYLSEVRIADISATKVFLSDFGAYEKDGGVFVRWETAYERNTLGFNLLRLDTRTGEYRQVNPGLLPGVLRPYESGIYSVRDEGASAGGHYTYKLVEVEMGGRQRTYGPFRVSVQEIRSADMTGSQQTDGDYIRKAKGRSVDRKSGVGTKKTTVVAQMKPKRSSKSDAKTSMRISIYEDGLYYIDGKDIASAMGLSEADASYLIKRADLSLSNQGKAVAYLPANDNAGLFFYGTKIDSQYTNENVYWLARGQGSLIDVVQGDGPKSSVSEGSFTETSHFEQDLTPWESLFSDPGKDYWFWSSMYSSPWYSDPARDFQFQISGLSPEEREGEIKVSLFGVSDTGMVKDHHVKLYLNGVQIGEGWWSGKGFYTISARAVLTEGVNILSLQGLCDAGIPYSFVLVDSFDVIYQRTYEAEGDSLFFRAEEGRPVTVNGFTTSDIGVFDVTARLAPRYLTNVTIDSANNTVTLQPDAEGGLYLAVASGAVKRPSFKALPASALLSKKNAAEYVVIAPAGLVPAAQVLADYRSGQGMEALVVDMDDIMNAFNYGIFDVKGIKDFLRYAHSSWKRSPKYVALAGDGSIDYKNSMGYGGSLIPSGLVPTPYGLAASDNYLADLDGDHMPEFAIGRLPVADEEELLSLIDKIKTYEDGIGGGAILLADNPDGGGNFIASSEAVAAAFPSGYDLTKLYLYNPDPPADIRTALLNGLNKGVGFFNYAGHGGPTLLADESLLSVADVASLKNAVNLPVMTAMTCAVGSFDNPLRETLAEALVLSANGGVAASWAPTGLSGDTEASILDTEFYDAFFWKGKKVLGDAVLEALSAYKKKGTMPYMMDIYAVLGDPALRMR